LLAEPFDFSLVLGGPLYQLFRRAHLCGPTLELLRRRVIVLALMAWLPLLILSALEGRLWGGSTRLPFLLDIEVHLRFLVVVPLLIVAELAVHRRLRPVAAQFTAQGLVPESALAEFDAAVASALRLRNSVLAEVVQLAFVYGIGVLLIWQAFGKLDISSWYNDSSNGGVHPSLAGWWLGCVSLPLFQFLMLRWYYRLFIWGRFLWWVSRIELDLLPVHPDRMAGLGFLSQVSYAFTPLLLAHGIILAGSIADRIFFVGQKLPDFQLEIIALVTVVLLAVLGPLMVFMPRLERAKRRAEREYSVLAQRCAAEFDDKWLRQGIPAEASLLATADSSALADLKASFETIQSMRFIPFTTQSVLQLAGTTLAPVVPLTLTMVPLSELLARLIEIML
jgi:hypothetical protein